MSWSISFGTVLAMVFWIVRMVVKKCQDRKARLRVIQGLIGDIYADLQGLKRGLLK